MRIIIKKNGDAQGVYTDILRSLGLGKMKIQRASDVIFNEETQTWESWMDGKRIATGVNRTDVVNAEHGLIEQQLISNL